MDGVTPAPFHILSVEDRALVLTEFDGWHLAELAKFEGDLTTPSLCRFVELSSDEECRAAVEWWVELTAVGEKAWSSRPRTCPAGPSSPASRCMAGSTCG